MSTPTNSTNRKRAKLPTSQAPQLPSSLLNLTGRVGAKCYPVLRTVLCCALLVRCFRRGRGVPVSHLMIQPILDLAGAAAIPVSMIGSEGAIGGLGVCGCVPPQLLRSNFEQGVSNPSRSASLQPFRRTSSICTVQYCPVLHCIMTMLCSPVVWVAALSGYASAPLEARGEEAEAVRVETSRCNPQVEPTWCWDQTTSFAAATPFTPEPDYCGMEGTAEIAPRVMLRASLSIQMFRRVAETRMQPTIW
jgi:hypothetical protein